MAVAIKEDVKQLRGFDDFVLKLMRAWKVNGVSVAIARGNEIIYARGFGKRDAEDNLAMTADSIAAIGSTTKTFTSMSLAILADEGLIDWDTPLKTYLPTFKLWDEFASDRMTPRDLMCHRSGLPRHDLLWYMKTTSRHELFDGLRYLEPTSDFRTIWQYQNLMFMTGGFLVGELTGMPWEDFVRTRILQPLGMSRTVFSVSEMLNLPDHSKGYRLKKNKTVLMDYNQEMDPVGPAGNILSSINDLSKWLLLHINKGKIGDAQFISEGQITQLHAPQMVMAGRGKHAELPYSSYGLGWFVQPYRGHAHIHHGGNIDGFSSMFSLLPDDNIGVAVLTNMNGTPVRDIIPLNVFDRFIGGGQVNWNARWKSDVKEMTDAGKKGKAKSQSDRVKGTRPSHSLSAYAGAYAHPAYGKLEVTLKDRQLRAHYNNMDNELKHYHYDTFEMIIAAFEIRMKLSFLTDTRGDVFRVLAPFEPTVKEIEFTRAPDESLTSSSYLEAFLGSYEIMGNALTVAFKGDVLQIQLPGSPDFELEPLKRDEFGFKGISGAGISFKRDAEGVVIAAEIDQGGAVFTAPKK